MTTTTTTEVKFTLGKNEVMLNGCTRDFKEVGVLVKRTYFEDKEAVYFSEEFNEEFLNNNYDLQITEKPVKLYNRKSDTTFDAIDHHLILQNSEYKDGTLEYYDTSASNTRINQCVRVKFQFEDYVGFMRFDVNGSGSFALNFLDILSSIEDQIIEGLEGKDTAIDGISFNGDEVKLITIDEYLAVDAIDMPLQDLLSHIVKVEVLTFDMEIMDDDEVEKPLFPLHERGHREGEVQRGKTIPNKE